MDYAPVAYVLAAIVGIVWFGIYPMVIVSPLLARLERMVNRIKSRLGEPSDEDMFTSVANDMRDGGIAWVVGTCNPKSSFVWGCVNVCRLTVILVRSCARLLRLEWARLKWRDTRLYQWCSFLWVRRKKA